MNETVRFTAELMLVVCLLAGAALAVLTVLVVWQVWQRGQRGK